jgi:hypothetical protein
MRRSLVRRCEHLLLLVVETSNEKLLVRSPPCCWCKEWPVDVDDVDGGPQSLLSLDP